MRDRQRRGETKVRNNSENTKVREEGEGRGALWCQSMYSPAAHGEQGMVMEQQW